jgi:hypothetical protein
MSASKTGEVFDLATLSFQLPTNGSVPLVMPNIFQSECCSSALGNPRHYEKGIEGPIALLYFTGTRRFSSSVQLRTMLIFCGFAAVDGAPGGFIMRKRLPSGWMS